MNWFKRNRLPATSDRASAPIHLGNERTDESLGEFTLPPVSGIEVEEISWEEFQVALESRPA